MVFLLWHVVPAAKKVHTLVLLIAILTIASTGDATSCVAHAVFTFAVGGSMPCQILPCVASPPQIMLLHLVIDVVENEDWSWWRSSCCWPSANVVEVALERSEHVFRPHLCFNRDLELSLRLVLWRRCLPNPVSVVRMSEGSKSGTGYVQVKVNLDVLMSQKTLETTNCFDKLWCQSCDNEVVKLIFRLMQWARLHGLPHVFLSNLLPNVSSWSGVCDPDLQGFDV